MKSRPPWSLNAVIYIDIGVPQEYFGDNMFLF